MSSMGMLVLFGDDLARKSATYIVALGGIFGQVDANHKVSGKDGAIIFQRGPRRKRTCSNSDADRALSCFPDNSEAFRDSTPY
jgi:hypothetical protein